jgi:hypothetical protein
MARDDEHVVPWAARHLIRREDLPEPLPSLFAVGASAR